MSKNDQVCFVGRRNDSSSRWYRFKSRSWHSLDERIEKPPKMAKITIFPIFKPSQHFYPACKNDRVCFVGRRNDICRRWYRFKSCSKSRLGVRGTTYAKIVDFSTLGARHAPAIRVSPKATLVPLPPNHPACPYQIW